MINNVMPLSYDSGVFRSGHPGRFHPDAAAYDEIPKLVALLLSGELWVAIWLAASALTAVWPW